VDKVANAGESRQLSSANPPILRVVLRLFGIGDVVLLTPALREWKRLHPNGRILVYCQRAQLRDVLLGNPYVDKLKVFRFWDYFRLSNSRLSEDWKFPNFMVLLVGGLEPRHAAVELAESIGIDLIDWMPEVFVDPRSNVRARRRLAGFKLPVAIHTTTAAGKNKNWTMSGWQQVVEMCPDIDFMQLGTREEDLVSGATDCRGLSIKESIALIANCRAYVGVDSGFAHIAGALRIASVILFGPTDPAVWSHPSATALYKSFPCSPCFGALADGMCPYGNGCMKSISPVEVCRELRKVIS
jgi:ADP-heptose:LPS heptosyltransferase